MLLSLHLFVCFKFIYCCLFTVQDIKIYEPTCCKEAELRAKLKEAIILGLIKIVSKHWALNFKTNCNLHDQKGRKNTCI